MRAGVLLIVAAVLAASVPRGVWGANDPVVVVLRGPRTAGIVVNGVTVMALTGPQALAAAQLAAGRLRQAAQRPGAPVTVTPGPHHTAVVTVGGMPIVVVDQSVAARHGTTPQAMASMWAQSLRSALAAPSLDLTPAVLSLSPGGRASVSVQVWPAYPLIIGQYDSRRVEVTRTPDGIMVTAKTPGAVAIPLWAGRTRAELAVAVQLPAARLPAAVEVPVTGMPSDPAVVTEAIRYRVFAATDARPGSTLEVGAVASMPLDPGHAQVLWVPVRARNPFARQVESVVRVTVRNVAATLVAPDRLLVSNRPETVTANGVLFAETINTGEAVRLLYHHRNGARTARIVTVTLTNPATAPARVLLTGSAAGPDTDVMYMGQLAAVRFLVRLFRQQGYLIDIPAGRAHTFTVHEMPPGTLVSGLLQAQVLSGQLHLTVHIRSPWLLAKTVTTDVNETAFAHPHGRFNTADVALSRTVRSGETALLTNLGFALGPVDPATGTQLLGDYGVVYRLTVELVNAGGSEVRFAFVAAAGSAPARGVVIIDGEPVDLGLMLAGQERSIASVLVGPQERKTVQVWTMPVAGSNYPVRLLVRPEPSS